MKLKNIAFAILIASSSFLGACNNTNSEKSTATETAETNTAPDSASTAQLAYICPMQCEGSASNTPGKCPVCTMDLVKNPDFKGTTVADSTAL
ncbi:heavy metal-binding domain-containing protein [Adhaeribacter radiodurans]|uniref:Heavy metal binding domain-containing protein n=1 Tax=Adhaeribacter radiodurans TaxID=2745197 RepID=A0A7L7LER2_9BACT|nr:heavy metal-binding domain-containing protein [Adhaeribacter radiodurans]QMU30985.1 hypothetical protein HUW48_24480 [Adhaeribacter radiodurans]